MLLLEEVVTLYEVYQAVQSVKDLIATDDNTALIEFLELSSDGEINTDTEILLENIKNSLQYDDEYTALEELSSRLELIDTRLDLEFECLNFGIGVIGSVLLAYVSTKFITWILRFLTA